MFSPRAAASAIKSGRLANRRGICEWSTGPRVAFLAAMLLAPSLAQPVGKYGELADRYGNPSRALREMMASQSAAAKNAAPIYRAPVTESPFAEWARSLQAKAEAEANVQRAALAKKENDKRRAEEERARDERMAIAADRRTQAAANAKAEERAKAAELHEKRFGAFIRTSQGFLQALRTGAPFPKERSETVADAMLVGAFQWKDGWDYKWTKFADLGITCTAAERFAVAIEIYRQRSTDDYQHWLAEAAYSFFDQGWITVQRAGESDTGLGGAGNAAPSDWHWSGLASALAHEKRRLSLNENQRLQAAALLAEIIQALPPAADAEGLARACLLVAAARQTPALAQIERLQSVFIPQVAGSVWAAGFNTLPAPTAGGTPQRASTLRQAAWLALAEKLILSPGGYRSDYPGKWFSQIRAYRRAGLAAASSGANAFLQTAFSGWLNRSGASPMLRRALQQEFDLTCTGDATALESRELTFWDNILHNRGVGSIRERKANMDLLLGQDPARSGVVGFLLAAGPKVMEAYIGLACEGREKEKLPAVWKENDPRWLTALSALQQFTDIPMVAGESLAMLGIAKERWTNLLKIGERAAASGIRMWSEANTTARLVRVRREILGEAREVAERQIYSSNPVALGQRLSALTIAPLTLETRRVAKALLAYTGDIATPAEVLTIARIRGPLLGDWARLGAWLDDPRRRPKNKDDPLYPLFLVAAVERDQAAGLLSEKMLDAAPNAVACAELEKWLVDVLAATGEARKKLIEDNFPGVIYCPEAASAYPDLRMLGYDATRGGFASRALLLLSTVEFDPERDLMLGTAVVELDDGKVMKLSSYNVETWLEAVAKLPRSVPAEVLLAQMAAGVQARIDWLKRAALSPPVESPPGLSFADERKFQAKLAETKATPDDDRRSRWVGEGCQQALARLAQRWSPVREAAQAVILAQGAQLMLDDAEEKVNPACVAARLEWERGKMRGLDDAEAFAAASAALRGEGLTTLAKLAEGKGWLRPLVLWQDDSFVREARAAASAVAAR